MKSLLSSLFVVLFASVNAQVIINEYSCSNSNGITDSYGDRSDWVELHNIGATAFDLTGYYLSDKSTNIAKWEIPAGASVPAGGFLMVHLSFFGWSDSRFFEDCKNDSKESFIWKNN
jgi:hypothetical protein